MMKNIFSMDNKIFFSEEQHFKQVWLWILLLGINGLFIFGLIKQVVLKHPFGDKPMPDAGLIIATVLSILFSLSFRTFRLETNIKTDGIYVRFFPFQWKFKYYPWDKLAQSFVRDYNPIKEYGGWGLRGLGKNRALTISGNKGIQLLTQDGLKLLIGTNKPGEAEVVLKQLGTWQQQIN